MDLRDFLDGLGLGHYRARLEAEEIDLDALALLSDEDLTSLGLPLGPRRKLRRALEERMQPGTGRGVREAAPGLSLPGEAMPPERRNLTILFCDMVGFTDHASRLDPEDLRAMMRPVLDACAAAVAAEGGFVAQFLGDGVMAYFGYPRAQEDAAARAARAGLAMVRAVRALPAMGEPHAVRVGIATGTTVVGDLLGDGWASETSAAGPVAAMAARLQAIAPPGGVLVSQTTRRLLGAGFMLRSLGPQQLKGFAAAEEAWQVLDEQAGAMRFAAAPFGLGTALVGRDAERARLEQAWRAACRGEGGRCLLLQGEAGIGKSRLVAALADIAGPVATLTLQCSPQHEGTALHPVIAWLGGLVGQAGAAAPDDRMTALRALPGMTEAILQPLARLLGLEDGPPADPAGGREALIEALAHLLGTAPAEGTVRLLVIEDLHWADSLTQDLVLRLAATAAGRPLLVLATARAAQEETPPLAALPAERILLGRLPPGAAAAMLDELPGTDRLPGSVRAAIVGRAGGVPLFLQELVLSMLEAGQGSTAGRRQGAVPEVPLTLQDALTARLDLLEPSGRQVLHVAAVLGAAAPRRMLLACTGLAEEALEAAATPLVQAGLMEWREDGALGFRHALIRDVAYNATLRTARTALHAHVARLLEGEAFHAVAQDNPELIATHWTHAGEPARAIPLWVKAAAQARARSAPIEELRHLDTAIELLAETPQTPERDQQEVSLRLRLATPLVSVAGWGSPRSTANGERIAELLDTEAPSMDAIQLVWIQGAGALLRSELGPARRFGERLIQMATRSSQPAAVKRAGHRIVGYSCMMQGDLATAEAHFTEALAGYAPQGFEQSLAAAPMDSLSAGLSQDTVLWALQGRAARLQAACDRLWTRVTALDHPGTTNYVLMQQTLHDLVLRDWTRAETRAAELRALAERQPIYHFYVEIETGWMMARAGELDAGRARMLRAIQSFDGQHSQLWCPYFLMLHAEMLAEAGRAQEALQHLEDCEAACRRLGQLFQLAELQRVRAVALARSGAPPALVEATLQEAMATARGQGAMLFLLRAANELARRHLGAGRLDAVATLLAPVLAEAAEAAGLADHAASLELLALVQPASAA